jgi:hypothetical protein
VNARIRIVPEMEIDFFGGYGEEETPVPIPNTEVKLFSADGTAREAVWESRSPPKILSKARHLFKDVEPVFLVKRTAEISDAKNHSVFRIRWRPGGFLNLFDFPAFLC